MNSADVLSQLNKHVGAKNGITGKDLALQLAGEDCPWAQRRVRSIIEELRMQGVRICGTPATGYFLAESVEEMKGTIAFLNSRAMASLRQISRLTNIALPKLLGQMLIDYEPEQAA